MTQCDRILRHLESGGSLTAAQAMQEYGIYRLASRINDLKKARRTHPKANGKQQKPLRRKSQLCRVLHGVLKNGK